MDVGAHAEVLRQAAAGCADGADGVGVVKHAPRAVALTDFHELGQRRAHAIHGEQAVGDHERVLGCAFGERAIDRRDIAVLHDAHLGPAGFGEAAAVDDAGVVLRVRDDRQPRPPAGSGERLEGGHVGLVAGGKEHGVRVPGEAGDGGLGAKVQVTGAGGQARPARACAEFLGGGDRGGHHARVLGQPQVVRGAEQDRLACVCRCACTQAGGGLLPASEDGGAAPQAALAPRIQVRGGDAC